MRAPWVSEIDILGSSSAQAEEFGSPARGTEMAQAKVTLSLAFVHSSEHTSTLTIVLDIPDRVLELFARSTSLPAAGRRILGITVESLEVSPQGSRVTVAAHTPQAQRRLYQRILRLIETS